MEDVTLSQSYSLNGCLQLNINLSPNNNNNNSNFSVPQNSIESGNIQINININTDNFQESSSLVEITKSFIDQSQQTDDLEYELKQENQKSEELSIDPTKPDEICTQIPQTTEKKTFIDQCQQTDDLEYELIQGNQKSDELSIDPPQPDEIGTQIPKNAENKGFSPERKHEIETKDENPIDNNNETMDNLSTVSDQCTDKNNENNEKQKQLERNQMKMNNNTGEDGTAKPNELQTKEIDLKSSDDLQCKNPSEHVNNNDKDINNLSHKNSTNEQSDSNNDKSLSDEKLETKNKESRCYESKEKMRKGDTIDNIDNVKCQIEDNKPQNGNTNTDSSCPNDSKNCQNITENENLNQHVDNQICNKNEQILTQTNINRISTIFDEHQKPGGLHNSASTCYMNAVIQALSSSNILINYLENISKSHSNSSVSLLYNLLNALNKEHINNETVTRNTNLLEDLIKSVGWIKPSQQDAFDLLSALICDIYKKSNDNDEMDNPLKIKLLHEFQGINKPNIIQEQLGLSLNLCGNYQNPPGAPLVFLIDQHFSSKAIDRDRSKLTRLSLYQEIPNILLIHIQANKWDPISCQMIKPIYYIQYDENMTLWFDIANEINGENRNLNEDRILGTEVEYRLKSIVYHVGNISGGHYVAYRKWREEWYLANDKLIKRMPLNTNIPPYIMIYERSL